MTEGFLYEDASEGQHIEVVATGSFPGPDVTLPMRSAEGKLYHVKGKREVLKSLTLTTVTRVEEIPGYNSESGVLTVG